MRVSRLDLPGLEASENWLNPDVINPSSQFSSEKPCAAPELPHMSHSVVSQLTQVILTGNNTQHILPNLAQTIGKALLANCCLIVFHPHGRPSPQITSWCAEQPTPQRACLDGSPNDLISQLSHPMIEARWTEAGVLAIEDIQAIGLASDSTFLLPQTQPETPSLGHRTCQFRAVLAIKMQCQTQNIGMLVVLRSQPHQWKELDMQLLNAVSPQVAIALSHIQLEQQIQQQVRYQNLIDQLTTAVRNAWSLEQIFQLALEGTVSALQMDQGMILLFKYSDPLHKNRSTSTIPKTRANVASAWPETTESEADTTERATHPEPAIPDQPLDRWSNYSFWASDCHICQQIFTGNLEPVLMPNSTDFDDQDLEAIAAANRWVAPIFNLKIMPTLLLMPLENQGTVLGCLVLQQRQRRLWCADELAFVRLVSAQLSTAIIQTRTLQQVQAVVQERTAQLQRSLDVQAKLYEKTRQQVEQLRRLNQEREEFLSTVSHELLTPLTSMTLAIRMLRQANLPPERQAKYLEILEQQCIQETNLINDLLALRKLESNPTPVQLQKLDVRYLVQDVTQSMEASWADKDLTLEMALPAKPLLLYTDSDSVNRILVELLTNAQKYADPGSTICLEVMHDIGPANSHIVLTLSNVGSGIPPDELPYIFDKFRRCHGVTKRAIQGTGLGLALVKGLVEHLNGAIAATSYPLEQNDSSWQTCFTLTLPQDAQSSLRGLPDRD
jgi:signal transduction histidine kinase